MEVFDLRDTDIGESGESFQWISCSCPGDTEVQCFGRKVAVLELLLGGERGEKITDRGILRSVRRQDLPGLAWRGIEILYKYLAWHDGFSTMPKYLPNIIPSLISTSGVPVFHSKLQKLVMAR